MWSSEQEDTTPPAEPPNQKPAAVREEAVPVTVLESLTDAFKSMSVNLQQSSQRHPPIPIPTKFNLGDNYRQWEGQVRRYLKHFPPGQQSDLLLSLLEGQAYGCVIDARVIPAIISESTFEDIKRVLDPPGLLLARQRELHDRAQRPGESILEFATALRRLGEKAKEEDDRQEKSWREQAMKPVAYGRCGTKSNHTMICFSSNKGLTTSGD
ncbi:hypothetical protein FGIG_08035 [Fasciola gigantica]|uniref:Uncharacterized protein n=1 Tax=Fasciola gigantica TaxID=46835 RepID=A0A504Z339_FASGI|nr:hypothetical protein FGIG_08035 [Fasciola gigantica]